MQVFKTPRYLTLLLSLFATTTFAGNAEFKFSNHCLNNLIYFEDLSETESEIVSWFWDFGDGAVATDENPVHAYTESGNYTVVLNVKTIEDKSFTSIKNIEIVAPPFAFFNPNSLCGNEVEFNDNSFTQAADVQMWMWDFGDGNYSMEKNPKHKFVENNSKNVHLKVLDKNGCWDSISQAVHIKGIPETGFDINNVILSNPAIIKINSKNQKDSVFYLINNNLFPGKTATVSIPSSESVNIKQKVIDKHGCTDSLHKVIHAHLDYHLALPAVFTPQKGNNTSTFGISNSNVKVNDFVINDSMGKTVFKTDNDKTPWNGRENNTGNTVPTGIYFYSVYFETQNGVKVLQKGKFFLSK